MRRYETLDCRRPDALNTRVHARDQRRNWGFMPAGRAPTRTAGRPAVFARASHGVGRIVSRLGWQAKAAISGWRL